MESAVDEVWLSPGAHPAVLARLKAEGLRVTATETLSSAIAANEQRTPPLALRLSLVTASVATLLTLLTLVAARVTSQTERRRDWRCGDSGRKGKWRRVPLSWAGDLLRA